MQEIACSTAGFSGSDLHHLCSTAASAPFLELGRITSADGGNGSGIVAPRPMMLCDLRSALGVLQASGKHSKSTRPHIYQHQATLLMLWTQGLATPATLIDLF